MHKSKQSVIRFFCYVLFIQLKKSLNANRDGTSGLERNSEKNLKIRYCESDTDCNFGKSCDGDALSEMTLSKHAVH
jgi:hypothetical protein